jgi:hypothetical protein
MGSSISALSETKWRSIERYLPPSKCDPVVIAAVLYRQVSGEGLRDTAALSKVSRSKLDEWRRALEADGSLRQVMKALKLKPAGSQVRPSGGPAWYADDATLAAQIRQIRLDAFRQALRG